MSNKENDVFLEGMYEAFEEAKQEADLMRMEMIVADLKAHGFTDQAEKLEANAIEFMRDNPYPTSLEQDNG